MKNLIKNLINRAKLSNFDYELNCYVNREARLTVEKKLKDYYETIYPNMDNLGIDLLISAKMDKLSREEQRKLATIAIMQEELV